MKAFLTLAFTVSIAFAQVELKVVATDYAGHPVRIFSRAICESSTTDHISPLRRSAWIKATQHRRFPSCWTYQLRHHREDLSAPFAISTWTRPWH